MVFLLQAARDILLLHAPFNTVRSSISQKYRPEPFSVKCIPMSFDNGFTLKHFIHYDSY